MISVYLSTESGALWDGAVMERGDSEKVALDTFQPEWIAYASHDYQGDDLRRRWDDPELERVETHPVVYVGAGSHASYFRRGEYLTELQLPVFAPLANLAGQVRRFWHTQLRQYQAESSEHDEDARNIFRIPFVDYARGDGHCIGLGQAQSWGSPRLLTSDERWLTNYRGLWGLYLRDPLAGENAPAGPMYNRDGTVRRSWYDPAGWTGLDKVAPPPLARKAVTAEQQILRVQQSELLTQIEQKGAALRQLGAATIAMRGLPHLHGRYLQTQKQMDALSLELARLRAEVASNQDLLVALGEHAADLAGGQRGPARGHIRRARVPVPEEELRAARLAEVWAAASTGLALVLLVALFYFGQRYLVFGLAAVIALFTFVEATFRGRLVRLVMSVTVALAVIASFVLLYEFFLPIVGVTVLLTGTYLLWGNLRELAH